MAPEEDVDAIEEEEADAEVVTEVEEASSAWEVELVLATSLVTDSSFVLWYVDEAELFSVSVFSAAVTVYVVGIYMVIHIPSIDIVVR